MAITLTDLMDAAKSVVTEVSVEEALALHKDPDILFVDVREKHECRKHGYISGARIVPRSRLEFTFNQEFIEDGSVSISTAQVVVYCAAGMRSMLAGKTLYDMGVGRVMCLQGGFTAWVEAGGEIVEPSSK